MSFRIGQGIDFHQLAEGRELWLGGVLIPHHKGCVAHSDGDVLLHAICDALLGSVSLGDIGQHFPDTDPIYRNADSKVLLRRCYSLVREKGYWIVNIDSTLLLQAPKIRPYVEQMQNAIAQTLHISADDVSIKATTTEGLSFIGREEGVVATASVLIQKY
jgi:2-C-methyl-D-erythritol 2,4-cyclodiphosphate synthase